MTEENKEGGQPSEDVKNDTTSKVNLEDTKVDLKSSANPLADRARADLYNRFDKQLAQPTDTSTVKEESKSGEDLKEEPENDESSIEPEEKPEKKISVKKSKESKEDVKQVPLAALHESRDRFRKLNLDHRDYVSKTEKQITDLQDQLKELNAKLQIPATKESDFTEASDAESLEFKKLRQEIAQLKLQTNESQVIKQQEAVKQQEAQKIKQIQEVSKKLSKEGYPGFDIALLKVGEKLNELVQIGDLTEAETRDPEVWSKTWKGMYQEIKDAFIQKEKEKQFSKKLERKKAANLVDYPGQRPEVEGVSEDEDEDISYDDYVKKSLASAKKQYKDKLKQHKV
jgi:hypothetical protein